MPNCFEVPFHLNTLMIKKFNVSVVLVLHEVLGRWKAGGEANGGIQR